MSGIKYYRLGDGEELPDEFCVIRDVNGEPDEYAWYEPMDAFDRKLWGIFKDNDWIVASEYRKLKVENDKLRQQLADVTESMGRVEERCAKLRELVRNMMQFFEDGDWCTTCECVQECDAQEQYEEDCLMRGVFHDRMRELGVEENE